ncbi:antitoxin [Streptomyces venezuelae]|uniref:antitoxin n=1 Tax=Streptomyces venezuelae TaxID=54571 RepID=UPI00123B4B17|nr:antitoxin [Streptomyces venezuelae]QES08791.1 antitoxin [Streptomyces venezuelae]
MGLLDSLKAKLAPAKDKVADLAQQHGDKIDHGIDKAARLVDEKTKGKYSDKIHSGTDKAKDALDRIGHKDDGTPGTGTPGGGTPGTGTPGTGTPGTGTPGSGGTTPPPTV